MGNECKYKRIYLIFKYLYISKKTSASFYQMMLIFLKIISMVLKKHQRLFRKASASFF